MGYFLAVANRKGGVGKSTISVMLAHAFAVWGGKRVLLIDLDAQSNSSLIGVPGISEAAPSVLVICRSAVGVNVSVSVAELLAGVGSVTLGGTGKDEGDRQPPSHREMLGEPRIPSPARVI